MKKIILISGKAENGKTALAKSIKKQCELNGERAVIMSYATTLKDYCKRYFGWDGSNETKPRKLLQELGTDVIRNKLGKPLFHAMRLAEDIEVLWDKFDYILVDDCRFPNEYYYMKAKFPNDVIFVNINRHGHISALTEEQLKHETETALNDFNSYDLRVPNNGTLEDLDELVVQLYEVIN